MSQSRRSAACSLIANRVIQWPPSNSTRLVGAVRFAAQPWGGSFCSYQPGMDGPFWVVPGLGPSQHEFSRRPARAGGLKAEPDPNPRHGRHGDSGQPLLAGRGRISRRLPPLQRCHRGTQHGQALPRRLPALQGRHEDAHPVHPVTARAKHRCRQAPKWLSAAGQRYGWRASRPIGRVLCTHVSGPTAIHLGLPLPAASCGLPASIGRAVLKRSRRKRAPTVPLPSWPCSGWGLPSRPGHPGRWWSLTPPFHPYLPGPATGRAGAAVCFLWHCPAGHPGSALPTTLPCGARTFLTAHRAARPPGRLARHRQDRTCRP